MPAGGLGSAAIAAIPGLLQTGGGILQSILGGGKAKKAQDALEKLQTPVYTPNKGIGDYYNTAQQRYGINPYQSQQYNYDINNANATTAAGVNALQDRRSAVGGIGRLAAIQNNAGLRAGLNAENQRSQNFSVLGNATNMKAGDDRMAFQQNQIAPFEKQYNLLAMKAGAGANQQNAGIQNAFGGLSSLSMIGNDYLNNKPYGTTQTDATSASNVPSTYEDYLRMQKYFGK